MALSPAGVNQSSLLRPAVICEGWQVLELSSWSCTLPSRLARAIWPVGTRQTHIPPSGPAATLVGSGARRARRHLSDGGRRRRRLAGHGSSHGTWARTGLGDRISPRAAWMVVCAPIPGVPAQMTAHLYTFVPVTTLAAGSSSDHSP